MSNLIVKAAINNLKDLKEFFDVYAASKKAGEQGNPFWSLYAGEDTKGQRVGYNWHISDPVKSWDLLEMNLRPYVNTGGTFLLTMSDKAKDNAPSVFKLIDFNSYRNYNQQGVNSINGIYTGIGATGNIDAAIQQAVETALIKKELADLKAERQKTGIGSILHPLTSHPNFNPNVLVNGIFGLLGGLMKGGGVVATNGVPQQYIAESQPQTEKTELGEVYEYDNNMLLFGLEKIRARIKGVRPETIIERLGTNIETIGEPQLIFLLSSLNIEPDTDKNGHYIAK